jgi:hypothetical protein
MEQSGPSFRARDGKTKLKSPEAACAILDVGSAVPCYVVTTIPPHDFHLGFETRLRERANKMMQDPSRTWTNAQMLHVLRDKFATATPPAQWLRTDGSTHLIIVVT